MHPRLQAYARHADGFLDAFLAVDDKLLRQDVQDFLVCGDGNRPRRVNHTVHIALRDLFLLDGDDAMGVHAADMAARDPRINGVDAATRHFLGFFNGALDRLHRRLQIDHHAFFQATGRMGTNADNLNLPIFPHFPDDGGYFGCADIQANNQVSIRFSCHASVSLPPYCWPCH